MADSWNETELAGHFLHLAKSSMPRAPLHAALSTAIGNDLSLAGLLGHAPRSQHQPVLLLAVIHSLILAKPDHPLAAWYPALSEAPRSPEDPALAATLTAFVNEHQAPIVDLLSWRRTQTNEVQRCAFLLAAMAPIADEQGPLAHIDVGTSAGLNLLLSDYAYRYDDDPPIGTGSPLLECGTRNSPRRPRRMIEIASSVGIDSAPLDATNDDDARWLKACVWPDQIDRFDHLDAALALARRHPPHILTGTANDLVADTVTAAAATGHPVITTSWVLNYFGRRERIEFLSLLDQLGAERDLTWIFAESPAQTPELPHAPELIDEHLTELTTIIWRSGERNVEHLATCHSHGYWIHFR